MKKNRIVITGGSGFIGSHLIERLLPLGYCNILVLDRKPKSLPSVQGVESVVCDVLCHKNFGKYIFPGDIVIHLACASRPASTVDDVKKNNHEIASLLVGTCIQKGIKKFIFPSSGGTVYGEGLRRDHVETDLVQPQNPYAIAKVGMEHCLRFCGEHHGLRSTIMRIANPYGRKVLHSEQLGAVDVFLRRAIAGKPITIWGEGTLVRDYIHIDDVTSFFVRSIEEELYGVYNIGSGVGTSLTDLVRLIESTTGKKVNINYQSPRSIDIQRNVLNIDKAHSTGWNPVYTLENGIQKLYKDVQSA